MPPQDTSKENQPTNPVPTNLDLPKIRTFKSDAEDALKGGASATTIAVAEQKRRLAQGESGVSSFSIWKIIGTIIIAVLILGGITAIIFSLSSKDEDVVVTPKPIEIISYDSEKFFSLNQINRATLAKTISDFRIESIALNSMKVLVPTLGVSTTTRAATTAEFLNALKINAPEYFTRSLGDGFLFGIFNEQNGNHPFLIFRSHSYQNTFAGLLDWERNMAKDLAIIFGDRPAFLPNYMDNEQNAESSVPPKAPNPNIPNSRFEDAVFKNKDVRVLRDQLGTVIFYSFIDKNTLVIADDAETFSEIVERLQSAQLLR